MLHVKRTITVIQLCLMMLPISIAVYAVKSRSVLLALLSVVAVFTMVAILPLCRRRESMWIFFILFLTATPLNVTLIVEILTSWLFEDSLILTNILRGGLFYLIALSIEELTCGFFARLIWRKQYKATLMQ